MGDNVIGDLAVLVVACGAFVIAWAMYGRQRLRELAMRERLALIERGLVPSPETDPAGFERLMGFRHVSNPRAIRHRSAGVLLMGVGVGIFVLLVFASHAPDVGLGVGGGIAMLGVAAYLNGTLIARDEPHPPAPAHQSGASTVPVSPPAPSASPEVPPNIAP